MTVWCAARRRPFRESLERLELCGGGVGDAGASELARMGALEHLLLAHNPRLGDRASLALAGLTRLRSLNLTGTQLTGNGILPLRALTVRPRATCALLLVACSGISRGFQGSQGFPPSPDRHAAHRQRHPAAARAHGAAPKRPLSAPSRFLRGVYG